MDRSSRLRSGTFDRISILPPRCMRKVRSLTLCTVTPGTSAIAATSDSACAVSVAAQVTSTRSLPRLPELTSSAVTTPPACSTARVISLTARPCEATSRRAVMEYDTLGAMVMSLSPLSALLHCCLPAFFWVPENSFDAGRLPRGRQGGGPRSPARAFQSRCWARQRVIFMHGAGYNDEPVGRRPPDGVRRDRRHPAARGPRPAVPADAQACAGRADADAARRAVHGGTRRAAAARRPGRRGGHRTLDAHPDGGGPRGTRLRAARRRPHGRAGVHARDHHPRSRDPRAAARRGHRDAYRVAETAHRGAAGRARGRASRA